MNEKRFVLCKKGDVEYIEDNGCVQLYGFDVLCEMLNEQQATIDILLEELVNAQQQGYVVNFLHKNEHCNLILKELDDEGETI